MAKWENISKVNKILEDEHLLSVKYINDGEDIITSLSNGIVRIYKNRSMTTTHSLYHQSYLHIKHGRKPHVNVPATSCLVMPNTEESRCLACYTDGHVNLFDIDKEKIIETVSEERQIFNVVHHPSDPQFISLGEDGIIFLYDSTTMKVLMKYRPSFTNRLDGHTSRVFAAVFHPRNHNEFISGGWDNTIMFWDTRTSHAVRFIAGPHICGEGVDINWNGKEILTAAYQQREQTQIWDYSTGKLILSNPSYFVENGCLIITLWLEVLSQD
ncbi:WD repeat domain-containing protein 83 homolog isoform X1 [Nilaparvata lugens]|uniref:WD repeat domain-containing protein 83 homolog isoform X1 n=2 Tax=Nilaparvata lugens TaxID=108931 RepID=UPI00193D0D27|nr:WD repeat domain-containing protein 83 homolog isoform X1 [Nilaparvata lugens]